LHKLLSNETGIKGALEPLLQWAEKQVPAAHHGNTPLFLLATAGIRKLENDDAEWLLDKAWTVLERSPFMCKRSWVKVISGTEEAYYGWVSLNYNFGKLGQTTKPPTLGALDLGGSSLQVTFESEEVQNKEYQVNLSVGTSHHHLYALSHAGFGLNDAFDKSVALVLEGSDTVVGATVPEFVEHPCLHSGFQGKYKCPHCRSNPAVVPNPAMDNPSPDPGLAEVTLIGKPDWESCRVLASSIISNGSRFSSLVPEPMGCDSEHPCALGRHQPVPEGKFYALSGFFVVYKFFGLQPDAGFSELLEHGKAFCEMPWEVALNGVVPQPLIEHYCFRAPYVVSLLKDGLHLNEEQITVGSGDITWTLGAALLEAGAFSPTPASRYRGFPTSRGTLSWDAIVISVIVFIIMMLVLFTLKYFVNCSPFGAWKSQSPLGPPRYPPSYIARLRLGRLDAGVWNGESL
jgi:apyrase